MCVIFEGSAQRWSCLVYSCVLQFAYVSKDWRDVSEGSFGRRSRCADCPVVARSRGRIPRGSRRRLCQEFGQCVCEPDAEAPGLAVKSYMAECGKHTWTPASAARQQKAPNGKVDMWENKLVCRCWRLPRAPLYGQATSLQKHPNRLSIFQKASFFHKVLHLVAGSQA